MRNYYSYFKSLLVMCILCIMGTIGAWADSYTYTAAKADFKNGTFSFTSGDVEWSGNSTYAAPATLESARGVQFGTKKLKNNTITLSTSSIEGNIESIVVNSATASGCNISLSAFVGGTQIGDAQSLTGSAAEYTFTPETSTSGEITLYWKATLGSVYIKSITINYTSSSEPVDPSKIAAPTFSTSTSTFSNKFDLTLSMGSDAEMIMYTLDGTAPSYANNNGEVYEAPISITHTTTVKAIAISNDGKESDVAEKTYTLALLAPTMSVTSKAFTDPFTVELSTDATASEGILYTLDGTDPSWDNESSGIYTEAISISATTTLKAISFASNGSDYEYSPVATATYTYQEETPEGDVIWSEDFSGFKANDVPTEGENATYVCEKSGTKVYVANLAGGESSPELLVAKSGGSFTATINNLKGCKNGVALTFKTNKKTIDATVSNATLLSEKIENVGSTFVYNYTFALNDDATSIDVKLKTRTTENVRVDDIELSKYENIGSFTITDAGYATYYTSDAYTMPEGATGYIVTGNEGTALTMVETYKEGDVVPANTALVVKGAAAKYSYLPTTSTEVTPADNKLHGSDEAETTYVAGTGVKYYKLAYDNNNANLGFYWGSDNGAAFENGAHKAYLALDGTTMLSQKRGFSLADLSSGITTGVNNVVNIKADSNNIFDINGRRINTLNGVAKGIYIVNGKKTLVK